MNIAADLWEELFSVKEGIFIVDERIWWGRS